jgi:hypothetical protein
MICNSTISGIKPVFTGSLPGHGKIGKHSVFLYDWPVNSLALSGISCDNLRLSQEG